MNTKILNELSLLNTALSRTYFEYLTLATESALSKKNAQQVMNIYSAYCYLVEQANYTAFKILNDSISLNTHFQSLIGFVYEMSNTTLGTKYCLCNNIKILFRYIVSDKHISLDEIKLSNKKITEDVSNCLEQFRNHKIDKKKSDYLNGWQVVSKEGESIEAHLDPLYVKFGEDFTNKVYSALNNYASTQKSKTLVTIVYDLKVLFVGMSIVYAKRDGVTIENYLSRNHVQHFFHKVFKVLFVRSQAAQHSPKIFYKRWRYIINIYTECFINTNVFSEPHKPFIVPEWKDPKDAAPTFSVGGNTTQTENNRWFANIPLRIKDEEAVSIIQQRVERDMAHIRNVCLFKFEELLEREARNKVFLSTSIIKPLSNNSYNAQCHNIVGEDKLNNTVATFYTHGIDAKQDYHSFLGFKGKAKQLNTELNLPTKSTLSALLTLLVIEHPLITPSWLAKWELFDMHGNKTGYKQVGNQYIAVSYKSRKGAISAQQDVVLNEFSKSIVEFLICISSD